MQFTTLQTDLTSIWNRYKHSPVTQAMQENRRRAGQKPLTFQNLIRQTRRSILENYWDEIERYLNKKEKLIENMRNWTLERSGQDIALWDWRWYVHRTGIYLWWIRNKDAILSDIVEEMSEGQDVYQPDNRPARRAQRNIVYDDDDSDEQPENVADAPPDADIVIDAPPAQPVQQTRRRKTRSGREY